MGIPQCDAGFVSDGAVLSHRDRALAQARRMIAEGADIIDIGAESTGLWRANRSRPMKK